MLSFLWLLSVLIIAVTGNDEPYELSNTLSSVNATSADVCSNLIPGLGLMALGYDITKLDLTVSNPLNYGACKPVLEFTCSLKHIWEHPNELNTLYSRPDQVSGIDSLPAAKLNVTATFNQHTNEVKTSDLYKVGLGLDTKEYGSYSASVSYQNVQENILVKNKSVVEVHASVISSVIDLREPRALTLFADFVNFINQKLSPVSYKEKPEVYEQFLATYGTHYFDTVLLGGSLMQKTTVENEYVSKSNEKTVKTNCKAAFTDNFAITNDNDISWSKVDQTFKTNSEINSICLGGKCPVAQQNVKSGLAAHPVQALKTGEKVDMATWVKTVNQNPWLLGGNLKPLENLIHDSKIKDQVRIATQLYRIKAYLGEINRAVQLTKHNLTTEEKTALDNADKLISSRDVKDLDSVRTGMDRVFNALKK